MKKNNDLRQRIYTTLDSHQSGFLKLRGHIPELIEQGHKIVFCFRQSEKLLNDLDDYNNGAVVEALKLSISVKSLKSQIHSMRRGKVGLIGKGKTTG